MSVETELVNIYMACSTNDASFVLPTGERVVMTNKTHRSALKCWIVSLFGNADRAEKAIQDIIPLAITKQFVWPYLVTALWNIAADKHATFKTNFNDTITRSNFIKTFTMNRVEILNDIHKKSPNKSIRINNIVLNMTTSDGRRDLLSGLIAKKYTTYFVLSPQFFPSDYSVNCYKFLQDRLAAVDYMLDSGALDADNNDISKMLNECANSMIEPKSEIAYACKFLSKYYSKFVYKHCNWYTSSQRGTKCYLRTAAELDELKQTILGLESKSYTNDALRTDWLERATMLGFITHPLEYFLTVLTRDFDPINCYFDADWYDNAIMCKRYNTINVKRLFPGAFHE